MPSLLIQPVLAAYEPDSALLVSPERAYLSEVQSVPSTELRAKLRPLDQSLELEYLDQYDHSLFSLGKLAVERKITLNGGGKALHAEAFELGFHIALNYTP